MRSQQPSKNLLQLSFREGEGHLIHDGSGTLPPAEIRYRFRNPRYISPREPAWRKCGPEGPALLFDGNSTFIFWPTEAITLRGPAMTFSARIAPRAFPCPDPEAKEGGLRGITAVMAQADPERPRGFLLGYEALGRPCFLMGDGRRRWLLRAERGRLERGKWNHLAAVVDGERGRMTLYLNGEEAGTMEIPAGCAIAPAEGCPLEIGRNEGGKRISAGLTDMFCGLMCEARIEAEALSGEALARRGRLPVPEIPWEDIGVEDILGEDPYRTRYHGGPRQHWMNEPHAPLYYRGLYHLFFQSNSIGSYWGNIAWGHLVSGDTVRWRQVQDAISPEEENGGPDGIWTGGAALDRNGIPVVFFTAGDLSYSAHGLFSNQNIGAAWPADPEDPELKEWIPSDRLAVTQQPGMGRLGEFRDPHVWREEDGWYMAVCGGSLHTGGGTVHVFRTEELEVRPEGLRMDWKYLGPAFEMENQPPVYGTSWELPVIMLLENRAGTVRKYVLMLMPAPPDRADNKVYYYLGDFDRKSGRFTPEADFGPEPGLLDFGDNIFTGPSLFPDPETGRICLFSIMQDKRTPAEEAEAGWAHCVGLTRNLRLRDDGTDVCVEPDPRLCTLQGERVAFVQKATPEEANRALAGAGEDLYRLRIEAEPKKFLQLTFQADGEGRGNVFRYDPETGTLSGEPGAPGAHGRKAPGGRIPLRNGKLCMDIFVDRSLTEGFFQGEKAMSLRSYGPAKARRVLLTGGEGTRILRLEMWRMNPI